MGFSRCTSTFNWFWQENEARFFHETLLWARIEYTHTILTASLPLVSDTHSQQSHFFSHHCTFRSWHFFVFWHLVVVVVVVVLFFFCFCYLFFVLSVAVLCCVLNVVCTFFGYVRMFAEIDIYSHFVSKSRIRARRALFDTGNNVAVGLVRPHVFVMRLSWIETSKENDIGRRAFALSKHC